MRRSVGTWVLLLLPGWALPAAAQEQPAKAPESPATLEELQKAYEEAMTAFWSSAKEDQEPDWSKEPTASFVPKFRKFAEDHAGKPEALKALVWLTANSRASIDLLALGGGDKPSGDPAAKPDTQGAAAPPAKEEASPALWAAARIKRDHLTDPALKEQMPMLGNAGMNLGRDASADLYEAIASKHPDREVQASATVSLAKTLAEGDMFSFMPSRREPQQIEADRKRAEELFRKIAKDFSGTEAAKEAGPYIFELEHLQVGMKAPEVVGTDIDGNPIKLSSFAGKVVVLDFWGFW